MLFLLALGISVNSLLSEILIGVLAIVLIYIIFKIGKSLLRLLLSIIANSILGFIAILALDYIFNLGIPLVLPVIISTAIFGLPAVGTMAILKLMGVAL